METEISVTSLREVARALLGVNPRKRNAINRMVAISRLVVIAMPNINFFLRDRDSRGNWVVLGGCVLLTSEISFPGGFPATASRARTVEVLPTSNAPAMSAALATS